MASFHDQVGRPKSELRQSRMPKNSSVIKTFRSISNPAEKSEVEIQESEINDDVPEIQIIHSKGCPKTRVRSKSRFRLSSPSRNTPHPKPWGARDPENIPCNCSARKVKNERSVTLDVKNNRKEYIPTKEVDDMFNNFCQQMKKRKVKLSKDDVDYIYKQLNTICDTKKEEKKPVEKSKSVKKPTKSISKETKESMPLAQTEAQKENKAFYPVQPNNDIGQFFGPMMNPEQAGYQVLTVKGGYYTGGLMNIPVDQVLNQGMPMMQPQIQPNMVNPMFFTNPNVNKQQNNTNRKH